MSGHINGNALKRHLQTTQQASIDAGGSKAEAHGRLCSDSSTVVVRTVTTVRATTNPVPKSVHGALVRPATTSCRPQVTHRDDWGRVMPDQLLRITDCSCIAVPPTPTTLPWHAPIPRGLNVALVEAVAVMFREHTTERMQAMVPYMLDRCLAHDITPVAVSNILAYLHAIHVIGDQSLEYPPEHRRRALNVVLDMYGVSPARPANDVIAEARAGSWTRVIKFSGDLTLTALSTTSITGTAAAAAYMTAAYAAGQVVAIKGAATAAGAAKATALAGAATLGATCLGGATVAAGVGSVLYWNGVIRAYRDVWDNDFAKDAWLFHVMREHHGLGRRPPRGERSCNHLNGDWTSPTDAFNDWRRGRLHN